MVGHRTPWLAHASRIGVACALALALLFAAAGAGASAAALPPQGLYDQCSPSASGDACASRLTQMGGAGFRVVLNYTSWDATPEQIVAFADAAAASGMQVIWPLNHPAWRRNGDITAVYPKLAAACGCTRAWELLGYVVRLVGGHGATWGWYVGDELPATELPAVLALVAQVKLLDPDPGHRTLYIAYEHSGTAGANLLPFAAVADLVGSAIYPYGVGAGVDPAGQITTVADLTRSIVGARPRAMVLQAFDWAAHPDEIAVPGGYPDAAFMRAARDEALRDADPSLLLWYSYNDIQKSDDPARHWSDLVGAAFAPAASVAAPDVVSEPAVKAKAKAKKRKATKHRAKAKAKKRRTHVKRRRAAKRVTGLH